MKEIKCPHCGELFTIDESGYAAIVGQVRDEEFHRELKQREARLAVEKENALKLARAEADRAREQATAQLQQEIERLKAHLEAKETDKQLAVQQALEAKKDELTERDREIAALQNCSINTALARMQYALKRTRMRAQFMRYSQLRR